MTNPAMTALGTPPPIGTPDPLGQPLYSQPPDPFAQFGLTQTPGPPAIDVSPPPAAAISTDGTDYTYAPQLANDQGAFAASYGSKVPDSNWQNAVGGNETQGMSAQDAAKNAYGAELYHDYYLQHPGDTTGALNAESGAFASGATIPSQYTDFATADAATHPGPPDPTLTPQAGTGQLDPFGQFQSPTAQNSVITPASEAALAAQNSPLTPGLVPPNPLATATTDPFAAFQSPTFTSTG